MTPKQVERRSEVPAAAATRKSKTLRGNGKNTWRLPSGAKLAEFALASGFLAPPLMDDRDNDHGRKSDL